MAGQRTLPYHHYLPPTRFVLSSFCKNVLKRRHIKASPIMQVESYTTTCWCRLCFIRFYASRSFEDWSLYYLFFLILLYPSWDKKTSSVPVLLCLSFLVLITSWLTLSICLPMPCIFQCRFTHTTPMQPVHQKPTPSTRQQLICARAYR